MQKSNEWFESRKGRFTGSRIHELMGIKALGKTGENYAFEMAVEIAFGRDEEESYVSFDMQRGIELEPIAFEVFKNLKELEFMTVEKCDFFPYDNDGGASPDGLVNKDAVLEIKCPKPNKFFKLVKDGIEAIDDNYIYQMQMEMLSTNSVRCHFFNYIIYNGKEMYHEIIVERDEEIINKIKERINEAVVLRNEYVKQLLNNKQF